MEHRLSPDESIRWWQDRLTPAWKSISGGCHLNRSIQAPIEGTGYRIERIETGYMPGLKPMTFIYEGSARPGLILLPTTRASTAHPPVNNL